MTLIYNIYCAMNNFEANSQINILLKYIVFHRKTMYFDVTL